MQYPSLGKNCGLDISDIGIGTVSLGVPYGIAAKGDFGVPNPEASVQLLRQAADKGITLFDTAPAYGTSESLLGEAVGARRQCRIATKMAAPLDHTGRLLSGRPMIEAVDRRLSDSRRKLRRECIDILQVHNLTLELLDRDDMIQALCRHREQGNINCLGATVYTADEAMAVIRDKRFQMIQVAYNLLDRTMDSEVMPAARKAGVGIVIRSVFLKGVLTEKAASLPESMQPLKQIAADLANSLEAGWKGLSEVSLRFSMFNPYASSTLVGIRRQRELTAALTAREKGPLSETMRQHLDSHIGQVDASWLNPMNWPLET